MLDVIDLNQFYGSSHTLWDMKLDAPEGSCTVLMGRNGVGKTTLLKTIMGLLKSRSGKIQFQNSDLSSLMPAERVRRGIGYVPQGREIFSALSVEENLRTGLGARRDGSKEIPARIFELFPVLKSMLHRRGGDLSGGQMQQLAIGRAMATDPKLILLDEPAEGIQPNIVSHIADVIQELKRSGVTVLLVEQKLPFAKRVADRFCIMDRGRQVAAGMMEDLSKEIISKHLSV